MLPQIEEKKHPDWMKMIREWQAQDYHPAATGTTPEGISAQAEQSCKNVGAILEAAGSGFDKVVKTTCFLADMGDFAAFNEVYAKYFTSKPARSCVAVRELPKGVLCEIEAIAVK